MDINHNTIFVFTYSKDLPLNAVQAKYWGKQDWVKNIYFVVSPEDEELFQPLSKYYKVEILVSEVNRKGNLNGRDWILEQLKQLNQGQDEWGYTWKIDSDTLLLSPWHTNNSFVGSSSSRQVLYGCSYRVDNTLVKRLPSEYLEWYPIYKDDIPEDIGLGWMVKHTIPTACFLKPFGLKEYTEEGWAISNDKFVVAYDWDTPLEPTYFLQCSCVNFGNRRDETTIEEIQGRMELLLKLREENLSRIEPYTVDKSWTKMSCQEWLEARRRLQTQ